MGNKEICNEQGDGKQRQAADFQFERFPPGEFLLHLDGLRDDAVAIDQGVSINNLLFDRNGLSGGLCLQRMMQNTIRHGSSRFGVFVLQDGCGVEGGHPLHDDQQLNEGRVVNRPDLRPDFHPGTVLDWKRPDSTASGSGEQEKQWQILIHCRFGYSVSFRCL